MDLVGKKEKSSRMGVLGIMNNKEKFNKYRQGILDLFNFDINNFEQSISGGLADNKQITDYLFSQLIAGIRV